jgi:cholesterol transport system auxiliary component
MVRLFDTIFDMTASSDASCLPRARISVRERVRSLTTAICLLAAGVALLGSLGGCSLGLPAAVANIRYDLGPSPTAAQPALPSKLPPLRLFDVRAPRALETDDILYRMSYADPRRTAAYANSHWTMRPSQLLTERVRDALAARGAVVGGGQAVQAPLLTIDLEQFEQVFDSEGQSHGALTARATLTDDGKVIAQQTFVARAPASMPNAAGGVHALAAASDDFVAQLVAWLGIQAGALTH